MRKVQLVILFLILNLGSLAIGSWLMNNGPRTQWYLALNKAPWTPPGWLFGVAWTLIMICFSFYLANLFDKVKSKSAIVVYIIQVLLNVGWNYTFFNLHQTQLGLAILLMLNVVLYYFFFSLSNKNSKNRYLLMPYMIWMAIATSLNLYVIIHN